VSQVPAFDHWLADGLPSAPRATVGHTYLPGDTWEGIEGDSDVLDPWTAWHRANPGSLLVLNVPLVAPNEQETSDVDVAALLRAGAAGDNDYAFQILAERLVADGAADTILIPAWEMNGTTYADRCGPDPTAWKAYWQRVVTVMRSVPGQRFRFDFDPDRGPDAIPWTQCYPGDAYVDIIGMDSYDKEPGADFTDYVDQPDGLAEQVAFAAAHHKPVSYPEWGNFEYGDDPAYVASMLDWIADHDTVYQTITDYCPHGVFQCTANPASSQAYRTAMDASSGAGP
jgi:glycosyl hydrolase family 26